MDFPMKEAAEMLIEPHGIDTWDAKNTVETHRSSGRVARISADSRIGELPAHELSHLGTRLAAGMRPIRTMVPVLHCGHSSRSWPLSCWQRSR